MRSWPMRPLLAVLLVLCTAAPAWADEDPRVGAREAYARGGAAHDRGDHETAAREFARADELVPSNAAIEAALDAAVLSRDIKLCLSIIARAEARPLDERASHALAQAKRAMAPLTGTIVVVCAGAQQCTVALDGDPSVDARRPIAAARGAHHLRVERDGRVQLANIELPSEREATVAESTPAPPPAWQAPVAQEPVAAKPATTPTAGGYRVASLVTGGLSLAVGGITLWSGLDTLDTHRAFDAAHCGPGAAAGTVPGADCGALADSGQSAQLRTNVLLVSSLTLALAAVAIELFLVPKPSAKGPRSAFVQP